jgi:tryptophanyl-tRNA synthetase
MRQHIALQERHPGECFYFIADYHALTTVRDAGQLQASVRELAIAYLALGLEPEKALLFRQSDVPEVTELAWLLGTVTGVGLLERAHAYKDRVARGEKPVFGVFAYPVLMAADILAHGGTCVPVGEDQIQHVEMAQDMATHFNEAYGRGSVLLSRPEWLLSRQPRVVGTDGKKMSTSHGNTIPIFARGDELDRIVGGIVTDSRPLGSPLDPDHCNVFALLRLVAGADEIARIEAWYRSGRRDGEAFGYADAKRLLARRIEQHFATARERRDMLLARPSTVEDVLRQSAARARAAATATLRHCREACGLSAGEPVR